MKLPGKLCFTILEILHGHAQLVQRRDFPASGAACRPTGTVGVGKPPPGRTVANAAAGPAEVARWGPLSLCAGSGAVSYERVPALGARLDRPLNALAGSLSDRGGHQQAAQAALRQAQTEP